MADLPRINFIRKWTHLCISFDFLANEAKFSMNGKLIEKFKDPKTSPLYENQFGGKNILKETKESKFMFIFWSLSF